MPNQILEQLVLPVTVGTTVENVTFDIQDAGARELISALGDAVYWIGVTTTALTDGDTTNPITVNSESITAKVGGMAQYDGEEFVWNGSAWQSIGKNNFGDLAFKNSASGSFTPEGTITNNITSAFGTSSVDGVASVGSLPAWTYDATNKKATFNAGALPTTSAQVVVSSASVTVGTSTFAGSAGTVTVS